MGEGRRWLFKLKVDDIRGLRDPGMDNPLCACNLARVVRRIKGRFPVSVGEFFFFVSRSRRISSRISAL